MKRILITAIMMLFSSLVLIAQPPSHDDDMRKGPEKHMDGKMNHQKNMDKILNHLDENVNLSEAQKLILRKY